jgi:site-specific DNA-methyltransferase (adenine-specific)
MKIPVKNGTLWHGDCLELMRDIPSGSVDMVLCDLPYGTTDCKWDTVIPFTPLWPEYWRIAKPNAAIVLTAAQPFTSALISSQIDKFKYEIIWDKVNRYTGHGNVSFMPLRRHENICIFVNEGKPTYHKQMRVGNPYNVKRSGKIAGVYANGGLKPVDGINDGNHNPCSIIEIKADVKTEMGLHPTQKPVALFEYLIKTYTNPGDIVLDNCIGSGTTAVASENTGRRWIGIERDITYYCKAWSRIMAL